MDNIICPVCRSTLKANGSFDLQAPGISILQCPVCNAPIWIPSGFPPQTWKSFTVVKEVKPTLTWAELKKVSPALSEAERVPASATQSVLKDTTLIPENVKGFFTGIGNYTSVIIVIVAIIVVLYLLRK